MGKFICAVLFCVLGTVMTKDTVSPPKVQLYSHNPGFFEKPNILICHVTSFHPPTIKIEILKDGAEIPNFNQTDLAFEENWHFHLTKTVAFTPKSGEEYTCKVTHQGQSKSFIWEPDM